MYRGPSLTIGIEEEYQIIDPETRDLRSFITQFLSDGNIVLREVVKPELHQSMVEVGTRFAVPFTKPGRNWSGCVRPLRHWPNGMGCVSLPPALIPLHRG